MSLRTVGEGHISSIIFRRGIIDASGNVGMEPVGPHHHHPRKMDSLRLSQVKPHSRVMERECLKRSQRPCSGRAAMHSPKTSCEAISTGVHRLEGLMGEEDMYDSPEWIATCDYDIETAPGGDITQLVLFPICQAESRGMEDMRLVRFTDDNGSVRYYGTYTAYDGSRIRPQMFELARPSLANSRLRGYFARNKGLALFPRKIDGRYVMIARIDGENLYLLNSDDLPSGTRRCPSRGRGTVGVRAGRQLRLAHRDRGRLAAADARRRARCAGTASGRCCWTSRSDEGDRPARSAALGPLPDERKGYVPNVVYSCGGLVHNKTLVIPYGISDAATGFATVGLDDLLARLS